jgi:DNA-binding CsgD family transcriptional regulator
MHTRSGSAPALVDRQRERQALDGLVQDLRSGRGWALVVRGEAGVGKSALLEYAAGAAADVRVARAVGVESEMELAFAGVHQLCAPLLDRLERLPGPQRDALGTAFGLRGGGAPDRFLVGLAVLTLLSEAAEDRPVLGLVDDAQWLDRASAQVLAFVARRLLADPVGLMFAARDPGEQLGGLPDLEVRGLRDEDARGLLRSVVRVRLDEQVRDRIVAETQGNPLALLELPRGLSPAQLAGGFGLAGAQAVPGRIEESFRQLGPLDGALARQTYLEAWTAALFAGRFAQDGNLHEVSRAARSAPPSPDPPAPHDLLLDALAVLVTDGRAAAAPLLRRAARIFAEDEISVEEGLRWGWAASISAAVLWDMETALSIPLRQVQSAREAGSLGHLVLYVNGLGIWATWCGRFAEAASLIAEAEAIAEATGTRFAPYAAVFLAGFRGSEADAPRLIEAVTKDARAAGQDVGIQWCQLVSAILYNGLGRYDKAMEEARQASEQAPELYVSAWALPELIEAASRTGQTRVAADALGRLAEATSVAQTDWAQGIYARSRALLSDGEDAETSYREAIDRLGRTPLRRELARAHLLYGEWLRRERRPGDAREQLRTAHSMLEAMGAEAFAERARRELRATGEIARKRTAVAMTEELTGQEAQIARLARDGLSNPEIGARLFISARTVQYHLGKVFTKLEISSRLQLQRALPDDANAARLASGPVTRNPPL